MDEATVVINGVQLNVGQAMALRVAIGHFLDNMQSDGLGESAEGRAMARAYCARASEIEQLMVGGK